MAALAELGEEGAVVAGGTWVMRARHRGEALRAGYVTLADVPGIAAIAPGATTTIGANVTHAALAELPHGNGPLGALAEAAAASAFPAVRNVATLAGNVFADPFPEAELVPALLVADASAALRSPAGEQALPLAALLSRRRERPAHELLVSVRIPCPDGRRSGYERLTVKAGGEYPVLGVALSVDLDGELVREARLACASVEPVSRCLPGAAAALVGRPLDAQSVEAAARIAAEELDPRESHDAPGWYRLAVLPALLRRLAVRLEV